MLVFSKNALEQLQEECPSFVRISMKGQHRSFMFLKYQFLTAIICFQSYLDEKEDCQLSVVFLQDGKRKSDSFGVFKPIGISENDGEEEGLEAGELDGNHFTKDDVKNRLNCWALWPAEKLYYKAVIISKRMTGKGNAPVKNDPPPPTKKPQLGILACKLSYFKEETG